jgi:short-subunit dehydrogenase
MGARIVLVARSKSRAEATLVRLGRNGPGVAHSVYFGDLTRLAEMRRVATEIANREPPIVSDALAPLGAGLIYRQGCGRGPWGPA